MAEIKQAQVSVNPKEVAYQQERDASHQVFSAERTQLSEQIQIPTAVVEAPLDTIGNLSEARMYACLEANNYFGYDREDLSLVAEMLQVLLARETKMCRLKPEFDITSKSPKYLTRLFKKKFKFEVNTGVEQREADQTHEEGVKALEKQTTEQDETATEVIKENTTKKTKLRDQTQSEYLADPEKQRKPASEQMREMLEQGIVTEVNRERFQAFLKIISLAQSPEDQIYITQKINAFDLSTGIPDPKQFIRDEIFTPVDDPNPRVSLATQERLAAEFGLPHPIDHGGHLRSAMHAKQQIVDPKTGETRTLIRYTEDKPLQYRAGVIAYVDAQGNEYLKAETKNSANWPPFEVDGYTENELTLVSEYMQFWVAAENNAVRFMQGTFFPDFNTINPNPSRPQLRQFRQIMNALKGGNEGYDGEIIQDTDMEFINWEMQYLSKWGDMSRGDNDVDTANANMQTLGLKDKEGRLDMEIVKAFGIFAQEQYMLGSPDFELLQWHLHALYPDRVAEPQEGGETVESVDANTEQ
ncbi:MAG: hypothetical protein ABW148_06110 [Sedimenticola sp.]